ncbi:MAG: bifunctional glycosyltransferase family 2/GtrA family protein [Clostridia bacterium]|nr:bifunctional glycosyltransferase family 2/GtrA family protein [Clostridia bacterium]
MQVKELCVLIPSLSPDERLPEYVDQLLAAEFGGIVVVNDGSNEKYDGIFERIALKERCTVLRHEVNRGKGQGLRTGIEYIRDHTEFKGVITADADGQHTVQDTLKLAAAMQENQKELLLGSRDFSGKNKNIPPRSRFGNRITSAVFAALYGHWLPDTQTGLRAVTRETYDDLLAVTGDRFEYEMNMLIYCATNKVPFKIIPIETIYLEENKSSHFNPIKDSIRIYKLLLGSFIRFAAASIASFVIDFVLLTLLGNTIFAAVAHGAFFAKVLARCVSAPCNFYLNSKYVFEKKMSRKTFVRYVLLAVFIMLVSAVGVDGLMNWLKFPTAIIGLVGIAVDTVLYLVSYRVQRNWVFKEDK